MMSEALLNGLKTTAKAVWFTKGSSRRCFIGPYAGLNFHLGTALLSTRMCVFYQAYESEVSDWLGENVKPGMVFYDIGAHIGIHSLYASKLLGDKGSVFSFEPWPENFAELQNNAGINKKGASITPVNMALARQPGPVPMEEGRSDGTHHLAPSATPAANGHLVKVQATTLDDFARTHPAPDVMKIDVEGFELDVLEGGAKTLAKVHPSIILEHHGEDLRQKASAFLEGLGYKVEDCRGRQLVAVHPDRRR